MAREIHLRSVTVSGMETLELLRQNLGVARGLVPISEDERRRLRERVAEYAKNGHFELYKTSKRYDADEGRAQHGYPPPTSFLSSTAVPPPPR